MQLKIWVYPVTFLTGTSGVDRIVRTRVMLVLRVYPLVMSLCLSARLYPSIYEDGIAECKRHQQRASNARDLIMIPRRGGFHQATLQVEFANGRLRIACGFSICRKVEF